MKCYKCLHDVCYTGESSLKIKTKTYEFEAILCDNCLRRIEMILEINGWHDENDKA